MDTTTETPCYEGTLTHTTKQRSKLAPIWNVSLRFVRSLPTYKDSKKGRANALQVRFALLAIGIGCIAFGESNIWIAIGVVLCMVPLLVPIESGKRTAWVSSTRRKMQVQKSRTFDVTMTKQKNRMTIEGGGETFTFSVKKKPRSVSKSDAAWLGFRRDGGKDRVWLRCDDLAEFEGSEPDPNERFDIVVTVDAEVFEAVSGG